MDKVFHLQIYHGGRWHDAATVTLHAPDAGIQGATRVEYDPEYFCADGAVGLANGRGVIDHRALSVQFPINLEDPYLKTWPAFLLDFLPQGQAKERLLTEVGIKVDDPRGDVALLERTGGAPIGNVRVREAAEQEAARIAAFEIHGITDKDIVDRTDRFAELADRFAYVASGSSGVAGEWPKFLCTRAKDGFWYPDPIVPDADAVEHVIIKMLKSGREDTRTILDNEAPYLEVARALGLRVGKALTYHAGTLIIPRFDRRAGNAGIERLGQESMIAALGVAAYGHHATHEAYLAMLKKVATNPEVEIVEYLRRDIVNMAMGNPDNHGRNMALQKRSDGTIGLSPLFDFTPMRLDKSVIARTTRWACVKSEIHLDWREVCEVAANGVMPPDKLMAAIVAIEPRIRRIPTIARECGVSEEVIAIACARANEIADDLAALKEDLDAATIDAYTI